MKFKKYLIALVLVCLFIIPPLLSSNTIQFRSDLWAWFVLLMGVVALSSFYLKINIWIKLLTVWLYINCFLSQMSVTSLVSYGSYLGALIIYVFCLRLSKDEFKFVLKIFPILFLLEILILTFQLYDKTIILKALDLGKDINFGTVSNHMMFGSMLVVMSFPLILNKKWYVIPMIIVFLCIPMSRSFPAFLAGCAFYTFFKIPKIWKPVFVAIVLCASIFCIKEKVSELSMPGHRGPIWVRLVQMSSSRPIQGWGLGTLKYLLPLNTQDISGGYIEGYTIEKNHWRIGEHTGHTIMWNRAHNDYLQLLFETGWMGILLLLGLIGWIIRRFTLAVQSEECLLVMAGLIAIGLNMIETYPSTMVQLVPVTVFLLAYFTRLTDERI